MSENTEWWCDAAARRRARARTQRRVAWLAVVGLAGAGGMMGQFLEQDRLRTGLRAADVVARAGGEWPARPAASASWTVPASLIGLEAAVAQARAEGPPAGVVPVLPPWAVDRVPAPIEQQPPEFPAALLALGVAGEAQVEAVVGEDGAVRRVVALDATHPLFAEAAVAAVGRWRFQPGEVAGHAVATRLHIPVLFNLSHAPAEPETWF